MPFLLVGNKNVTREQKSPHVILVIIEAAHDAETQRGGNTPYQEYKQAV